MNSRSWQSTAAVKPLAAGCGPAGNGQTGVVDDAKAVLRVLGYDSNQVNNSALALSEIGPGELLPLPEIEVDPQLLHANGFAAI